MTPIVLRLNDGTELRMTPGGNALITARDGNEVQIQRADLPDVLIWLWHRAKDAK